MTGLRIKPVDDFKQMVPERRESSNRENFFPGAGTGMNELQNPPQPDTNCLCWICNHQQQNDQCSSDVSQQPKIHAAGNMEEDMTNAVVGTRNTRETENHNESSSRTRGILNKIRLNGSLARPSSSQETFRSNCNEKLVVKENSFKLHQYPRRNIYNLLCPDCDRARESRPYQKLDLVSQMTGLRNKPVDDFKQMVPERRESSNRENFFPGAGTGMNELQNPTQRRNGHLFEWFEYLSYTML
ncbi:unnamed protein product [Nezara viridula]|uniref:Uncharacterized protein n=1 Tax=Nezara viridula TaxID=85310 RepID=A0A9P0H6V8_NEZVI|nr:unnamed protein product [Nezara viridula]